MRDYPRMKTIQPNKNSPEHEYDAPGLIINGENLPPQKALFAVTKQLDHE